MFETQEPSDTTASSSTPLVATCSSSSSTTSATTTQSDNSLLGVLALTSAVVEQSHQQDAQACFDQELGSSSVTIANSTRATTSSSGTGDLSSQTSEEASPLPTHPQQPIKTIASDKSLLDTISNIVPAVHLTNLSTRNNNTSIMEFEESEPAHSPRRSTRKKTPKKHFSPGPIASSSTTDEGNDVIMYLHDDGQDPSQQVSYLFGPPWSQEELTSFLVAFHQYKNDWESIKEVLPNRTTEMIQGLYEVHKRFIELDCTIDVKKLQFYEIHQDYIHNSVPHHVTRAQKTKNSAKKRTNEFSENTSPSKKKLGSPTRQRFAKSPKNSNSKTISLSTPPTTTLFQTNVKRKQKIIFEPLPAEFIESSMSGSASGEAESVATTFGSTQSSNNSSTSGNNTSLILCSTLSQEQQAPPSSPTTITVGTTTSSNSSSGGMASNAPINLQSPLSPTATSSADLSSLAILSPDSKKNYEKNKMLPIKLRKKGTHGNPLLKHVQLINGDQNDTDLIEAAQNSGVKMYKILTRKKTRAFCASEWFYPTIDFGFYDKNEFVECLSSLDEPYKNRKIFKKSELKGLRVEMCKKFGKPRRLSQAFLKQERAKLELYRGFARDYYQRYKQVYQVSQKLVMSSAHDSSGHSMVVNPNESSSMITPFTPPAVVMEPHLTMELSFVDQLPYPFKKNEQVLVLNPETQHVQLATIMDDTPISKTDYKIRFNYSKEERIVQDTDMMQIGTVSLLPVQKRELIPQQQQQHAYLNTSFSSLMIQSQSAHTRPLHTLLQDHGSMIHPQTPPRKREGTNISFLSSGNDTLMNTSLLSSSSPTQHSPFHFPTSNNLFQSPPHPTSVSMGDHGGMMAHTEVALQQTPNKKPSTSQLVSPNSHHQLFSSPLLGGASAGIGSGASAGEEHQDFIMMAGSPSQVPTITCSNLLTVSGGGHTIMSALSSPPLITPGMIDLNHASPEIIRNIAKCIVLLRKKHELVKSFKQKNDRARMLLLVAHGQEQQNSVFDRDFCIDYTKIVLDLKQVNTELETLLPLMRAYCSTPSYATTNYPINKIFSQSISKQASIISEKFGTNQMFQDIFELNREHAKEIVNTISSQILKQFPMEGSRLNIPSSFSQSAINQNFTEKIYNCIALLLHLRSCCMNPGVFKDSEIDLFIEAGLMALQDQPSANDGALREIFVALKDYFLKPQQQPQSSSSLGVQQQPQSSSSIGSNSSLLLVPPSSSIHHHHHTPQHLSSTLPLTYPTYAPPPHYHQYHH
ncbi:hypothetical protein C9374_004937 [Naegleria lovaniensis]|uniref:SANT domain-containing protein n=1 Tax=Naegleria lovaniensis TaxID=51637 RepID=A0AA88KKW3_NAELO|nr:uncharacterized protein C9374_004937 [Naegleria lovaniensis]KAG2382970.1 hypothetical protein C9374_004937 [Naegleria lovaniensis]